MRLFVLILGLVLMLPAGLYLGWQGLRQVPVINRVLSDFAAIPGEYAGAGKGMERLGGLLDRATRISIAMGKAGGDNDKMLEGAMGVLADEARRDTLAMLTDPAAIHPQRIARIERAVTPEQFLTPGETLPEREWLPLFMKTRIVMAAEPACGTLQAGFAKDCQIADFDVSPLGKRDAADWKPEFGPARFTLFYTPSAPVGPLPGPETAPEIETQIRKIQRGLTGKPLTGALYDAALTKAANGAEALCAARRLIVGNCMVSQLVVAADGAARATLISLVPTRAAAATN